MAPSMPIVCAQAFHWFANPAALAEIHRVLKPGGMLGLIWNVRDESVAWVAALTRIMAPYEAGVPRYHSQEWRRLFPAEGFGPLRERHFPNSHSGPAEEVIVERILSVSFIAALAASGAARCRRGNPGGDRRPRPSLRERADRQVISTASSRSASSQHFPPAAQRAVAAEIRALIAATPELAGKSEVASPYDTAAFRCVRK